MKERYDWIVVWLKGNLEASSVNQAFHEAYHVQFPRYKRRETYYGAQPVAQAMRDLQAMYRQGLLIRRRVSIGNGVWVAGFPKSALSYSLPVPAVPATLDWLEQLLVTGMDLEEAKNNAMLATIKIRAAMFVRDNFVSAGPRELLLIENAMLVGVSIALGVQE